MNMFSGLSRPLKAAGLVLIGVAVVAAVIGGVTALNSGNSNDSANPPPSSASQTPTPSETATPTPTPSSPSTSPSSSASPTPSGTSSPTSTQSRPSDGNQGDDQASAKWVTVRVLNNSTIRGLAARAAEDFRRAGWNVGEPSNYSAGIIPATTAYFRPGTDEETAAKALAAEFGMRVEARFAGIQQASPGVIVIVTNNYQGAKGKSGS